MLRTVPSLNDNFSYSIGMFFCKYHWMNKKTVFCFIVLSDLANVHNNCYVYTFIKDFFFHLITSIFNGFYMQYLLRLSCCVLFKNLFLVLDSHNRHLIELEVTNQNLDQKPRIWSPYKSFICMSYGHKHTHLHLPWFRHYFIQ